MITVVAGYSAIVTPKLKNYRLFKRLVTRTKNEHTVGPKECKMAKAEERQQDWEKKPLYGRSLRSTDEVASSKT